MGEFIVLDHKFLYRLNIFYFYFLRLHFLIAGGSLHLTYYIRTARKVFKVFSLTVPGCPFPDYCTVRISYQLKNSAAQQFSCFSANLSYLYLDWLVFNIKMLHGLIRKNLNFHILHWDISFRCLCFPYCIDTRRYSC